MALNRHNTAGAFEALQLAVPNELGATWSWFGALYSIYIRGLAYLASHEGAKASAEFQRILEHRGIVQLDPIGALARLQLGRALALAGDKHRAKAAYDDFLTLWTDADSDILIFKEARAEYRNLR